MMMNSFMHFFLSISFIHFLAKCIIMNYDIEFNNNAMMEEDKLFSIGRTNNKYSKFNCVIHISGEEKVIVNLIKEN